MTCSNPIDPAVLADYWIAALPAEQEKSVEEHIFECQRCEAGLRETFEIVEGVRSLARKGSLRLIVNDAFLRRAAQNGVRVRQYSLPAGSSVECTVTAEDDLLIARLAADFQGTARVDLSMCDLNGDEIVRLQDIPAAPDASAVLYQESIAFAKGAPTAKFKARLIGFDEAGHERLIGEYAFNHHRSLPGPGGQAAEPRP